MQHSGTPLVSVVIPVRNGADTLPDCLRALNSQTMHRQAFEVIVVDDGSTDGSGAIAERAGVRVIRQAGRGAPAARNAGIEAALGRWVAFTDADCVPARRWLQSLLDTVSRQGNEAAFMGTAGPTRGLRSETAAARFVDLSGGLDAARHLSHPRYPFAPTANAMYRRDLLDAVGGFDTRFATYDACDLHTRICRQFPGLAFPLTQSALVLHRHRPTWRAYFRQQRGYGRGYAQFFLRYRDEIRWNPGRELAEWARLLPDAVRAVLPGNERHRVLARGEMVRRLAQRIGFTSTYWSTRERSRWKNAG